MERTKPRGLAPRAVRWTAAAVVGLGLVAASLASAQQGRGPLVSPSARPPDLAMSAPDPPAIRSSDQYVLTFRYEAGKVTLVRSRRVHLAQPRTTPRNTGRYALELLSGRVLAERVRFDFPLLGADELAGSPRQYNAPPRFEGKASVTHEVMVPDSPRFAHARLVDRATGRVLPLAWPPDQQAVDGGLPDAAARPWPRDAGPDGPYVEAGRDAFTLEAGRDAFFLEAGRGDARWPQFDARLPLPEAAPMQP